MAEAWRQVPGWPGYEVSDMGRIRSVTYRILRPSMVQSKPGTKGGQRYRRIGLTNASKRKTAKLHALIAEAFFGPRAFGYTVDHKDFDRGNNAVTNLEYVTIEENLRRGIEAGVIGQYLKWSEISEELAEVIRASVLPVADLAQRYRVPVEAVKAIQLGIWRPAGGA